PLGPRLDAYPRPAADPKVVAGLADPVQDPRAVRGVLRQVGLEPHVDRSTESHLPLQGEADLRSDGAPTSVSPDRVAGCDGVLLAAIAFADHSLDHVLVLRDAHELGREPDVRAVAPRGMQDHRLQYVLRGVHHRARARAVVVGPACRTASPGHQPGDLLAGEAGGPHVVAHQLVGRGDGAYLLLDAQVPEDLDGTLVGDVGARGVRRAGVLRHRDGVDARSGEQRAGRQPRRASTNHENVGFGGTHRKLPVIDL